MDDDAPKFEEWAVVELFGHQRIVGKVSEQMIAGHGFVRVDVPEIEGQAGFTRMFGPKAIYAINPTTEALARQVARTWRPAPVQPYDLPALDFGSDEEDLDQEG